MKNFKKLKIWQKGMEIVKKTYAIADQLPDKERFGLRIQVCKAAVSIPSNIAEGSAKRSVKDRIRYLEISQGSAFELETELLVIEMVKYCNKDLIDDLLNDVDEEQKMIEGFIKTLESNG
jgi:four helix bundle protein